MKLILSILFILIFSGCMTKDVEKIDCNTTTTIKRSCDSVGTGKVIILFPADTDNE